MRGKRSLLVLLVIVLMTALAGTGVVQAQVKNPDTLVVVRFGDPATEIVGEAEAQGADLIAMATHRRGVSRFLRGSLADAVERETTIPVLRVPYGEAAYV